MWEEIELVATRKRDPRSNPHALRDLGLLVLAAVIAVILPLLA